jgi:long-chain fatty acid transport protein
MPVPDRRCLVAAITAALLGAPPARASFFQIAECCPAGLGNAFAGGAAAAEDACTVWFNPAGMVRLAGSRALLGVHSLQPSIRYRDRESTLFLGAPLTGGEGGDAGDEAFVPNAYLTHRFGDRGALGLGVNAPFGLITEYEPGWVGRYHALRSDIETINVNLAAALRVAPTLSLGFGLDYQTIDAELSQAVDYGTTCVAGEAAGSLPRGTCAAFSQAPQATDGVAVVEADDDAFGYNAGLLLEPSEDFRLGLHYRSEISYGLEGRLSVSAPDPATAAFAELIGVVDSPARAAVDLPDTLSASAYLQASPAWAVLADASRTGWSSLPELRISFTSGAPDQVTTLDLEDSWRYAVGTRFAPGSRWAVRLGVALDETPVPDARRRTLRLPDEDRTWYTVGLDVHPSERLRIGLAYALIEVDEAEVDKIALPGTEDLLRGNVNGAFDLSVDVVSLQASWSF